MTDEQLRMQIKASKADTSGQPLELWLMVKCSNVDEQKQLADRLRLEGHSVKLTTKDA